jgi:hypothetical protein
LIGFAALTVLPSLEQGKIRAERKPLARCDMGLGEAIAEQRAGKLP